MKQFKHIMVVDGYNVLNQWDMVNSQINLEAAREDLIHILSDYAGYQGIGILLVFDAHMHSRLGSEEIYSNISVIYTKRGETADTRIEGMIRSLVRAHDRVTVVTADYTLQLFVMGEGALRMSPNELKLRIETEQGKGVIRS